MTGLYRTLKLFLVLVVAKLIRQVFIVDCNISISGWWTIIQVFIVDHIFIIVLVVARLLYKSYSRLKLYFNTSGCYTIMLGLYSRLQIL